MSFSSWLSLKGYLGNIMEFLIAPNAYFDKAYFGKTVEFLTAPEPYFDTINDPDESGRHSLAVCNSPLSLKAYFGNIMDFLIGPKA